MAAAKKPLSTKARKSMPASDFAIPATRQYPIEDASHARNALARVARRQNGTPAQKAEVKAAVKKKYPNIAVGGAKPKGK